ncbi:MAG: dTDP-4-dehydrorhamnose 3,5-epimerase [Abditibacteriota bacterium]|nr:dTDP-4-dehydrorhamnose 3,5-epimerase [Abditibacteriota bacterium]
MTTHSGNFTFHTTSLEGVYIIDVKAFGDRRGYFMETYRESDFDAAGLRYRFVQDNQSSSSKGVLRGLHFQKTHPQAKLVRVLAGEVFDVAVDLRRGSPTYGQWTGVLLSGDNRRLFMVPRGFAHGFQVVSDYAEFAYKCDDIYHPEDEGGIRWNDPDIGVRWPLPDEVILSDKDRVCPFFADSRPEFDL